MSEQSEPEVIARVRSLVDATGDEGPRTFRDVLTMFDRICAERDSAVANDTVTQSLLDDVKRANDQLRTQLAAAEAKLAHSNDMGGKLAEEASDWQTRYIKERTRAERANADAARYRWLVAHHKRRDWIWNHVLTDEQRAQHNSLQAAIDAALISESPL